MAKREVMFKMMTSFKTDAQCWTFNLPIIYLDWCFVYEFSQFYLLTSLFIQFSGFDTLSPKYN